MRRISKRAKIRAAAKPKRPRLKLKIARGLEKLRELPEGTLSMPEQTVLRRIDDILTGVKPGQLRETDFNNMKRIARKYRVKL